MHFPHFFLIFTSKKQIMARKKVKFIMFVAAQSVFLKSGYFKNLMRTFTMYFLSISQIIIFSKIHAGGGPET